MKLQGKVAIVTGGARDLGRAISIKFAQEGAKVVVNYFDNPEDAAETLKLIQAAGSEGIIVQKQLMSKIYLTKLLKHLEITLMH